MSAYIIADVTVTDAKKMAEYRQWSTRAMQAHGAEVLVHGGDLDVPEGPWTPRRWVVPRFSDRSAAHRFYPSPIHQHARKAREDAGVMRRVMAGGVS